MNNFNRLHPEIIHTHILPRLDGTSLTALSSVSSEFRHMICNNDKLWKTICTSTWPYLPCWNHSRLLSNFPCGYRSFVPVSDALPSLHHNHNNNSNSQSHCIDRPPTKYIIFAIAMYLQGEPDSLYTIVESHRIEENMCPGLYIKSQHYCKFNLFDNSTQERKEGCKEYFRENFRLNWVVIDPTQKRAGSLFHSSCKPVSVQETLTNIKLVYTTVLPMLPGLYTEMMKCHVEVKCFWRRGWKGLWVKFRMKDINRKIVNTVLC
ncbi:F-box protein At2g27310-like [Vicia villosa]|uniref:F-box protein At2g27310-like n=1 Tax=Vicia villosa TaxID=3911 RepID=UPI00273B9492|nr:F-box protein At2g27310-like [Vicia villosa]